MIQQPLKKLKKQLVEKYEKCGDRICLGITKFETDPDILSELLELEAMYYRRTEIVIEILNNSYFNSELKSIKLIVQNFYYGDRIKISEKIINSDIISAILEAECKEIDERTAYARGRYESARRFRRLCGARLH